MLECTQCLVQEHAIRTMYSKCHYKLTRVYIERVRGNMKPTYTSLLRQSSHASAEVMTKYIPSLGHKRIKVGRKESIVVKSIVFQTSID